MNVSDLMVDAALDVWFEGNNWRSEDVEYGFTRDMRAAIAAALAVLDPQPTHTIRADVVRSIVSQGS